MRRKDLTPERQDAILDATERCIARYGLQGTTLKNIAAEAKINRRLIYHYVGNREDVVQLSVEQLLRKYQAGFKNFAATQLESNRVDVIIDYYFDAWFEMARKTTHSCWSYSLKMNATRIFTNCFTIYIMDLKT